MKLRVLTLITGAIAIALTASPYTAHANTPSPLPIAQDGGSKGKPFVDLKLSDEQKQNIKKIHSGIRQQIRQLLKIPPNQSIDYKSLTPEQTKQIRNIYKEGRQNIYNNVLNANQRKQLDDLKASAHQHKQ